MADAPDTIEVRGIRAWGHHGVLAHERELGQEFVVDVVAVVDLRAAGATDDLADTVDYGAVAERVVAVVGGPPVQLIERLAADVAAAVLSGGPVERVTVTVRKPSAPFTVPVDEAAVTITRP